MKRTAALLGVLALAGCGGTTTVTVTSTVTRTQTHTVTVTTSASTTPKPAAAACTGDRLQGSFDGVPGSAGAGQIVYRLNPDCPIFGEIRSIVRKTIGLAKTLRESLEPLAARIELAYVYGSFAQGEERPDSDVDLMIVGDVSLREISPLLAEARRLIQREISPTLYRSEEYAEALRDSDSFVRRVHDGPRVDLIGGDG